MIKAIETHYKGYRFRSRLEARWAVFFDALGLEYKYEFQGFKLSPTLFNMARYIVEVSPDVPSPELVTWMNERQSHPLDYLPDFWLPDLDCWAEVKGEMDLDTLDKATRLGNQTSKNVILLKDIGEPTYIMTPDDDPLSYKHAGWDTFVFRRCPLCCRWALRHQCGGEHCSEAPYASYWCPYCVSQGIGTIRVKRAKEWVPVPPHDELSLAITAARSARFEHGETPRVQRGKPKK